MGKWHPMQPATLIPYTPAQRAAVIADIQRMAPHMTVEQIERAIADRDRDREKIYKNLTYQAHVIRTPIGDTREDGTPINLVHLSIRRIDRNSVRDWRDLQRIKNELIGPECEMVELFPAESRLVDTANQYHLWGVDDPRARFSFGFNDGRVVDDQSPPETNTKNRRLP